MEAFDMNTILEFAQSHLIVIGFTASIITGVVINRIAARLAVYAGGSGAQRPEVAREGHPGAITAIHDEMKDGAIARTCFESTAQGYGAFTSGIESTACGAGAFEWTDAQRAAILDETADEMRVPDWPGRNADAGDRNPF